MQVIFCEKLGLLDLLAYGWTGRQVFYGSRSLFARFALMLLSRFKLNLNMGVIELGYVRSIRGVRRNAYRNAEKCIDSLGCEKWASRLNEDLGFDFRLFWYISIFSINFILDFSFLNSL